MKSLSAKNAPRPNLKPYFYRIIYKNFAEKCKFFRSCSDSNLFGMCVCKEIYNLMPSDIHVHEMGIECSKNCPFFDKSEKEKIKWVKPENVRKRTETLEYWNGKRKPRNNHLVLAFSFDKNKWMLLSFPIAKLYKMPYRRAVCPKRKRRNS